MVRIPSRAQVRITRSAISPRLAIRTERIGRGELRNCTAGILHPVHGALAGRWWFHRTNRQTEREYIARVGRLDKAVIPEPRRAIIGVRLLVEHRAQFQLMLG